ncbi:MAG: hypothetical protein FWC40_05575 [Proteobacteria bacterium]|nr:hypothetical protein [Pseudomonadota bacterium]
MALDTKPIETERKALQVLCEAMQEAGEDERELLMAEIEKSAAKLEMLCAELQAEADATKPAVDLPEVHLDAVVEVVLTPDQRRRVLEKTGIDVPSVRIQDPTADLTKFMPQISLDFIEKCAIEQAEAFKAMVADAEAGAEEAAKAEGKGDG